MNYFTVRNRSLITGRGGGGYTSGGGGQGKFYPYIKRGAAVFGEQLKHFSHADGGGGGHRKFEVVLIREFEVLGTGH